MQGIICEDQWHGTTSMGALQIGEVVILHVRQIVGYILYVCIIYMYNI